MALFGLKSDSSEEQKKKSDSEKNQSQDSTSQALKEEKKPKKEKKSGKASETKSTTSEKFNVLKQPRITEKATYLSGDNVYTFIVDRNASKTAIKEAVQEYYGVEPISVRTAAIPAKSVALRGRRGRGVKGGGKKAYVKLKEGDRIELV